MHRAATKSATKMATSEEERNVSNLRSIFIYDQSKLKKLQFSVVSKKKMDKDDLSYVSMEKF